MPKAKSKAKVEMPMVKPPSQMSRNQPRPPTTLRVCGNTVPVYDGKSAEADPKILRARKRAEMQRRGLKIDETRI